ncbi:SDR family oxidoreductase [Actinoallomurus sp. NPDC052308]|uniref:SDR family oxidoreductase n=1 Tax=Actinoallomurus sp. NPDC052308 TaxID=3155530 RepID=UPI00343C0B68
MLSGKVAVITGAGPGLGRTLAGLMVEEGARVVVSARSRAALEETAAAAGALAVPADVRDPDQVQALARTTVDRFGRIDVLVNAAFPGTHRKNVLDMDPDYLELWRSAVETATYGTLLACRYLAPYMVEGGGGSIVNVTSLSSRTGYAGRSDYATGKAGVHLLSHCLADELGPLGVRVNCVAPGWIASDALTTWMETRARDEGTTFQAVYDHDVDRMALRRIATEEDVARAVMFLAGDGARAITGATIDVNGGQLFT